MVDEPRVITVDDVTKDPSLLTSLTPAQVLGDSEMFSLLFLKIPDKITQELVPFRWNKVQKHRQKHRTKRDLILKSRQIGATTIEQAVLYWKAVAQRSTALTLSHDDNTTALLRRMQDRFYEQHPFHKPARAYANATLTTYPETGSEAMMGKAGSVEIARGANLTDFVGDEAAFWPDAEKIIAGALQSGDPSTTILSTANGASGPFFEMCMAALDGNSVWNLLFYPWYWEKSYCLPVLEPLVYTEEERLFAEKNHLTQEQIAWRRNKQLELGRFYAQEYPESPITAFLTSGEGYFGNLDGVFTAPENAEWQPDHRYRAGLDFAQSKDYTDMVIIDTTTRQQVYYLHINRMEWAELRARVKTCYNIFRRKKCPKGHISVGDAEKCSECGSTDLIVLGLKSVTAEKNSIGQPNIEALFSAGVTVESFLTDINSKRDILANLYEGLHTAGLKLLDIPVMRQEFNSFISVQTPSGLWTAKAARGAHDDAVISCALAFYDVPPQIFLGE